jgi:hypothetical protein
MEGLAQELGKIEQKTRWIVEKGQQAPPPVSADDLADLLALLEELLSRGQDDHGSGSFSLAAPCETGVVKVASWPAGKGDMALLQKKVGALAELLQHHKDLRQPICRQKASGEEVTVIFEEI